MNICFALGYHKLLQNVNLPYLYTTAMITSLAVFIHRVCYWLPNLAESYVWSCLDPFQFECLIYSSRYLL